MGYNGILLENKNGLPFEMQNHCKLRLEEIHDIQRRFSRHESINSIHKDYPQVSRASIYYWCCNREKDLARRKLGAKRIDDYKERRYKLYDAMERRRECGLPVGNVNVKKRREKPCDLTKFSNEMIEEIFRLFESGIGEKEIAKRLGTKKTKIRSLFQSIKYRDRYKKILELKRYNYCKKILEIHDGKGTVSEKSKKYGLSYHCVYQIVYGLSIYKDILKEAKEKVRV